MYLSDYSSQFFKKKPNKLKNYFFNYWWSHIISLLMLFNLYQLNKRIKYISVAHEHFFKM